jgi:hypothetical protein
MSKKLLAFAALSAWLAACSAESSTEGDQIPCVEDGDCPTGFSCGDGYCEGTSSSTADAGLKPSVDGGGVVVMASGDSQGVDAEVVVETDDCKGPSCEIEAGDSVTFSAPDVEGYRFTGWSGDERCVGVERTLTLTNVKANIQCVANYVKRVVVEGSAEGTRVTASSSAPFADCSGSRCVVDEGSAVVLSVDARDGYRFTGFVGTGCENTEGMSVSVTASKSDVLCTAGYVQSFAVTGSIEGTSGSVTASSSSPHALCAGGACSVDPGATVELTAPTLDDYRFAGWSGDPGCVGTAASLTLTVIDAGIDCTANYVRRVQIRGTSSGTPTPVALSASSTNSFAECSAGGCEVDEGSTVVLSAPTVDGYRFTGFAGLGCEDVSGASVTVVASGDVVCTASYVAGIAVIGNVSGASGTVAASSSAAFAMCSNGVCVVDQGSDVTLLAPIVDGHRFLGWSGDSGCTGNSRTLALLDVVVSKTCTANFEAVRVTVTGAANPAAGGSVSASASAGNPSCSGASCTVNYGTSVTLNANENTGYEFAGWSGDCSGTTRPFALNSVTQNRACTASFRLRRVTLNLATSPTNLGQVSIATPSAGNPSSCSATACTVDYGTSLTIQAAPTTSNARFSAWGGSQGCAGAPSHAVTLDGNKTCTATYIQQYDIAAVVGPAGGGTVSASVGQNACASAACTVDPNTQVTLRAAPSLPSHRFVNWTGANAACTGSNETLTLQNVDAACTANFALQRFTVSGTSSPSGRTVTATSQSAGASCGGATCTVNYGSAVTLTATASTTDYQFHSWSGSGCSDQDVDQNPLTLTLSPVTASRTCTAVYRIRVGVALAAGSGSGGVNITNPGTSGTCATDQRTCWVTAGTSVTINAATTSAQRFVRWAGSAGCAGAQSHALTVDAPTTCQASFYNLWATSYAQPYGKSGRDALLRDFAGLIPGTDNQLAIVGRASHIRRYGIGIDTLDDNSGRVLSDRILLSDTTNMYGVDVAGDLSEHVIVGSYGVNPSMGMLQGGRDRETGFHYAFKSGANTNLHEVTSLFNGQYAAVGSEGTSREEQGRIVLIEPTGSLVANRALRMTMQDNQTCTKTIMPTRVEGFAGRATNAAEPYVAVGYGVYQFNDTTSVRYLNLWSFTSAGNTASVDVWLDSQGQSTYSLTPHGILALARGRFLIYGMRHDTFSITSATDAFWVLTDANLKPVAQGRLGNPEISEAFHHAVEGENGDIVLVGRAVRSRRQDFDALFVRLNREGVLQSQMLWASELDDTFNRVLWMPEGGYAISGTRSVVGAQSPFDFQQWAARTDENGSMPFGPNSGFNAFDPKLPVGAINATATPWLCHANTDLGDNRFDVTGTEADPETTETPHVP